MTTLDGEGTRVTTPKDYQRDCPRHAEDTCDHSRSITPRQDPENYTSVLAGLLSLLTRMERPTTDRHITDINLQGLAEVYRDAKLVVG